MNEQDQLALDLFEQQPDVAEICRLLDATPRTARQKREWEQAWCRAWRITPEDLRLAHFVNAKNPRLARECLDGRLDLATAANMIQYGAPEETTR